MTEESTVDDFPASTDLQDADSQWSPPRKGAANAMASFFNDGTLHTRNLILRGVAGIYLMAFIGFYHQSPGLFGNNGIVPARIQIEGSSVVSSMHKKPSLLHLGKYFGLDTEYSIDVLALLGAVISFTALISQKVCILPTFAALWSLYFSLIQVADVFGNQCDQLLLEAGFFMLLLAPLNFTKRSSPSDRIALVLIRWLLFRFLFESGSVKLISHCPKWWSFTALAQHFEVLPLPTPFSWYAFNQPESWSKVGNIFTNLTELVCVWFFFFPHRTVKRYLFYWQLYLQMWIVLTGNYGFLNFLVPVLLLALLDDDFFLEKDSNRNVWFIGKLMLYLSFLFMIMSYLLATLFESLMFDEIWMQMLRSAIKPAPLMAMVIVLATFLQTLTSHPLILQTRTLIQKLYVVNTLIAFTLMALMLIGVSMVPHGNIDKSTNITNSQLGGFYQQVRQFHIVNEYGQHLRKMRTVRQEIIYEHAQDVEGPWEEYGFLYKPWAIDGPLPFTGPYFARFDHKFYDASASTYRSQLWTVSTAYRLLQNDAGVLALFGSEPVSPPPKYVRAVLYQFKYNQLSEGPNYWTRKIRGEYFPAFSLDNPSLLGYLRSMRISPNYKAKPIGNTPAKFILDMLRAVFGMWSGTSLVIGAVAAGIATVIWRNERLCE